ncbi:MAG: ATP-grasp domain-containing protein [Haloferacaceae archaeon]
MLRLAVATKRETFGRIRGPLGERGVAVEHVPCDERVFDVSAPGVSADGTALEPFDAGFVYPSRLMEGGAVDALLSIPWVNGLRAVATSRNKAAVYARLAREGIPTPETRYVSNPADESDVAAAAREVGFPVVVKPNSTTRGTGVARLEDLDSLLGVVDYLDLVHDYRATGDRSYLLQEFLPDAADYRVMVVDGDVVGGVRRRLPDPARADGRWKHNVHRGGEAEGIDVPEPASRLAERTARALDIDYLGVDLLRTDDRWVVNETNARPTVDDADKYDPDFYDRLAALIESVADRG